MLYLSRVSALFSQDSFYVSVHFIHGSRPAKEYKEEERKWRGGTWGGHVGVNIDSNRVIDFKPRGRFHWFSHRNNRHSQFSFHTQAAFWTYFGTAPETLERTTVRIPVTSQQIKLLDTTATAYVSQCPYDYAFIGMRCASASYDILMQAGVFKKYSRFRCCQLYFYPEKLRKRLLKMADENRWLVTTGTGSERRRWDKG